MGDKKLENVEPAYAAVQVADADAQIAAAKESIKQAEARKKLFAPHVKKTTAKD